MINLENIYDIQTRTPCKESIINDLQMSLQKIFLKSYIDLLLQTNGFDSDEVRLYPAEEILERNETYEVNTYCPDYIAIGDDGAGNSIVLKNAIFDEKRVFSVGHGVMTPEFMEVIGEDFLSWLEDGCPLDEL